MTLDELIRRVGGYGADVLANAWQGGSGRWYINSIPKDFYALGICRLTGVLTPLGIEMHKALASKPAEGEGYRG